MRSAPALAEALRHQKPALVIIDLHAEGAAVDAIRLVKDESPSVRVVAFLSHVQRDLAAEAAAAGADEVLARSEFVRRLPELLLIEDPP